MVGIALPSTDDLPPGPLREMVEALHDLYRGAGSPGLRRIAATVVEGEFRDTVSHEKVAAMLRGAGLPRWSKLEPVVRVLAGWNNPRRDADEQAARLRVLWQAANVNAGDPASSVLAGATIVDNRAGWPAETPDDVASQADASDLVGAVGAEMAARARVTRKADTERGYRDGVQFARDLPSPAELDALNRIDFDVAEWIGHWRGMWSYTAAGMDSHGTDLPAWTWKAARYLGTLADPIGYDQFSFTPSPAYVAGLGDGLRAVYHAMHEHETGNATAGGTAAGPELAVLRTTQVMNPGDADSSHLARSLSELLRGHGGLDLDQVEQAGQTLLKRLQESFEQAPARQLLPTGATMSVDWFQVNGGCTYGDRPYRGLNWHYHGLKIVVTMATPEALRAECTPIPGISRARDAEYGLIAIDANRPAERPLLLSVGDMYPAASPAGQAACDAWVEQCLTGLLTEFGQMLTGALARLGYDT